MEAEYFTHLGIARKRTTIPTETLTHDAMVVMNPGGRRSGAGTPHLVSDIVNMETDELLAVTKGTGFGVRKQEALKCLVRPKVIQPRPSAHNTAI